ncbi:MAG: LamG-like jellyroll fold domain-containing protein, partial [Planctomycetota bacterium]
MYSKSMFLISFALVLAMVAGSAHAQVAVAEELLVDLSAEDLAYGEGVTTWPNRGSLGDFAANGSPVVEDVDGIKTVTFDGSSWFDGPTSTPGIEGAGTRTIEVWVYNPAMPGEETMVSWSHRGGPGGSNIAFNYGNDNRWGSVGHWGGDTHDMGWWTNHSPAPAANTWWHIVYTYDGTGARIYVNGELESTRDPIPLDTHGGNIIRVAAQADDSGAGVAGQFNFTGSISVVRIHDGALSQAEIQNNFKLGRLKAWNPYPADGAILPQTWVNLSWTPGGFAVSHDVYLGDNFDDVNEGRAEAYKGNSLTPFFIIGFPGFAFSEGLVPGTTYYWRVDEINEQHAESPWKGDVWRFMIPPSKAYAPVPADGAEFVSTDVALGWAEGFNSKLHHVYFGDDRAEVEAGTGDTYKGPVSGTSYTPAALEMGKTYYWRVDEFDAILTHAGDVWSLTTIPVIAGADPNLVGWWKLDEGQGTSVVDWSGQGNHGTLIGGAEWIDAYDGGGVKLDGSDDYVALPIGPVISSLSSATFTTWVDFSNAGGAWQRIFDFGSGTGTYIFLCPRTGAGGPMRLAITTGGGGGESLIDAPNTLVSGWHHVAAVVQSTGIQLYLDGTVVASGPTTVVPSDLGQTTNNWLGRSQYSADGYLNASLDDFRIYDYAMSQDQIKDTMRGDPMLASAPSPANRSTPDVDNVSTLAWSPRLLPGHPETMCLSTMCISVPTRGPSMKPMLPTRPVSTKAVRAAPVTVCPMPWSGIAGLTSGVSTSTTPTGRSAKAESGALRSPTSCSWTISRAIPMMMQP